MILSTANRIKGVGGCPSVFFSTTNPTWTDMVVTLVIRYEKPATEEYPICKSEKKTHPGK